MIRQIAAAVIRRKALKAKKLFSMPRNAPQTPHIMGPRKYPMPQKR
ncbi:MAG: hypothetical protein ACOXZ3_01530 [Synergistaceae bacterium]